MKSAIFASLLLLGFGFGRAGTAAETGFYAGANLGVTEPAVGKSDGIFVAFAPLPGVIFRVLPESTSFDGSNPGWDVHLGYRVNRYLAAELAYSDFGSIDIHERFVVGPFPFLGVDQFVATSDATSRVTGPSVNVLGILPLGEGIEVFGRTGLLFADQTVQRMPGNTSSTVGEELWVIGGGFNFEIFPRISARIAYESVDTLPRTSRTGPIRLQRFVFGLSYDF